MHFDVIFDCKWNNLINFRTGLHEVAARFVFLADEEDANQIPSKEQKCRGVVPEYRRAIHMVQIDFHSCLNAPVRYIT